MNQIHHMLLVLLLLMYLKKFKSIKSNRLFCNEARKTQSWRCIATFHFFFVHSNFYNWWFRWFFDNFWFYFHEFMQIFCVLCIMRDEHVSYYTPQIFIYFFIFYAYFCSFIRIEAFQKLIVFWENCIYFFRIFSFSRCNSIIIISREIKFFLWVLREKLWWSWLYLLFAGEIFWGFWNDLDEKLFLCLYVHK